MVDILLGQLVFPIYMSYGVIFWIFILILWCMMLSKVLCNSTSHVPKSKRNPQNRSLSETHSEDYSQKMNKRFDKAQDIEEDESGTSHDTLVKRSKLVPHHAPPREPSSSGKNENKILKFLRISFAGDVDSCIFEISLNKADLHKD